MVETAFVHVLRENHRQILGFLLPGRYWRAEHLEGSRISIGMTLPDRFDTCANIQVSPTLPLSS